MKYILIVFFSLVTFLGFGQSITAPEPKSFILNTNGQDASGFVLNGFSSTSTLLCAIGLPQSPSGTTFNMTRFDGLTPASGFNFSGNKTRLVFTGTMANINTALATLKVNTTGTAGNIQISVSATVNPSGYFYNPTNGHFYRPISTGATFANAITLSSQQTFKGQTGYLVTITSNDEDLFIFNNVPQSNIWFAADDRATEGRWVISAGPEVGTLLKTSNGQTAGNVQGVYNNWAGGEPNDWGGNEDAAVTKWGGGFFWNDLSVANVNPYVIEFGTWTNPDDQTFTEFVSNSVNHSNGNTLRTEFNFNFGSNVDETMFRTRLVISNDNLTFSSNNSFVNLNGLGRVNMTSQMDTVLVSGGFKAFTTMGQVEWSIINPYDANLGGHRLQIDEREFYGTGINLNTINSIQLFDIYDGPMTPLDFNGWWKQWVIPGNHTSKIQSSAFQSYLRLQDGWYGIRAEYSFAQNMRNKFHRIEFGDLTTTQNASFLGNMVTVSDVYLAFRELSDKGIMGDESKYFSSGIQFHNADVNNDRIFDERDCYLLLTHLQGTSSLWSTTPNIGDAIKVISSTTYDSVTKQNWVTLGNLIGRQYPFSFTNGILNSYNLDITWKGDVNLSHSSQPTGFTLASNSMNDFSQVKSMSTTSNSIGDVESDIMMEKVGENIVLSIVITPNGNQIGATQFDVYFDNSILDFIKVEYNNSQSTNFAKNNGSFISLGSLNTSGGSLSNIGYKVIFKPKSQITNTLGLITVKHNETLSTNLNKLNVKVL